MNAEQLAHALADAPVRRVGRAYRAPCPAHADCHPSLDIEDKGDLVVFVCRAGCTQRQVIDALMGRGLWTSGRRDSQPVRNPFPASAFRDAAPPGCCLQGPPHDCEHWKKFDTDMMLAELRKNLLEAAAEVVKLYETAGYGLDAEMLHGELDLAVDLAGSAIVRWHLDAAIVEAAIDAVVMMARMEDPD